MNNDDKLFEILFETEKVADKILLNKRSITELSQRKEDTREAMREITKSQEKNAWITISGMLIKVKKEKALELLKKDQETLDVEINQLRDANKMLLKRQRDVEKDTPLKGFDLKPLNTHETSALRSNLPSF